jgi:hypothetical protein
MAKSNIKKSDPKLAKKEKKVAKAKKEKEKKKDSLKRKARKQEVPEDSDDSSVGGLEGLFAGDDDDASKDIFENMEESEEEEVPSGSDSDGEASQDDNSSAGVPSCRQPRVANPAAKKAKKDDKASDDEQATGGKCELCLVEQTDRVVCLSLVKLILVWAMGVQLVTNQHASAARLPVCVVPSVLSEIHIRHILGQVLLPIEFPLSIS